MAGNDSRTKLVPTLLLASTGADQETNRNARPFQGRLVRVTQILTVSVLGKPTLFNACIVGTERKNGQNSLNRDFGPSRIF
jgi:hypothetical protein